MKSITVGVLFYLIGFSATTWRVNTRCDTKDRTNNMAIALSMDCFGDYYVECDSDAGTSTTYVCDVGLHYDCTQNCTASSVVDLGKCVENWKAECYDEIPYAKIAQSPQYLITTDYWGTACDKQKVNQMKISPVGKCEWWGAYSKYGMITCKSWFDGNYARTGLYADPECTNLITFFPDTTINSCTPTPNGSTEVFCYF